MSYLSSQRDSNPRRSPRRGLLPPQTPPPAAQDNRQHSMSSPMFKLHAIEDRRPGERLKIILSGRPRAQQRPRIGRAGQQSSNSTSRPRVLIYNPSHQAQNEMRQLLQEIINSGPEVVVDRNGRDCFFQETVPLKAVIKFFLPRPNTHFKRNGRRNSENFTADRDTARRNHINRPDLDNMVKFVLDAMQGVVYSNDSHIVSLSATKSFDNRGSCNGRISIEVTQADNHNLNDESDNSNIEEVVILDEEEEEAPGGDE